MTQNRVYRSRRPTTFRFEVAVVSCLVLGLVTLSSGVTTTHYDKPPETKLLSSTEDQVIKPQPKLSNLTLAERQKRLLPYINFYISEHLSHPHREQLYQNDQRYQVISTPTKIGSYQPDQTKFSELMTASYQPNNEPQPQFLTETKGKFTPFLESNALPGPFTPMITAQPQKIKVSYTPLEQSDKIPNYSTIYDKLSQLKLQQSALGSHIRYPNTRNNVLQFGLKRKPTINLIPIHQYQQEQQTYNPIQLPDTYVHAYTPTNIEVPTSEGIQYEVPDYASKEQVPIKGEQELKAHPDEITIAQEPITVMQVNAPTKQHHPGRIVINEERVKIGPHPQQNYVPTITINPQAQYIIHETKPYHNQKHMQYLQEIIPTTDHRPLYLVSQKVVPIKQYTEAPKQEEIKAPKPPIIIFQPITSVKSYAPEPVGPQNYQPIAIEQVEEVVTEAPVTTPPENPNSLSLILKRLQESNALPHTLTPDNIDNSIKTLVQILSSLKKQQKLSRPIVVAEDDGAYEEEKDNEAGVGLGEYHSEVPGTITETFPANTPEGGTPGRPGVDYPALSSIPHTNFNCKTQRYKGFFADPDTHCQVWHYCDLNGGQASFLCPNGTIFSQVALTCDWWFNVKCSSTPQLYVLNERLYKYIIPLTPKFPEDYTGPLVDRYLAMKFKEMEEKMNEEKKNKKEKDKPEEVDELQLLEDKNSERIHAKESQETDK